MSAQPGTSLTARSVVLLRALFAAAAAVMITFSPDHSVAVGLAVFSGFAVATGLVYGLEAWFVATGVERKLAIWLGVASIVAGAVAGIPALRTVTLMWIIVPLWAVATGVTYLVWGIRQRRADQRAEGRDSITIGVFGLLLAIAILVVPPTFSLDYFIAKAGPEGTWFTLTGETIATGMFGGWAAITAVFLAIAALSPSPSRATPAVQAAS